MIRFILKNIVIVLLRYSNVCKLQNVVVIGFGSRISIRNTRINRTRIRVLSALKATKKKQIFISFIQCYKNRRRNKIHHHIEMIYVIGFSIFGLSFFDCWFFFSSFYMQFIVLQCLTNSIRKKARKLVNFFVSFVK